MTSEHLPPPTGGLEQDPGIQPLPLSGLRFDLRAWRLIQVDFQDRTDVVDQVVREQEYLLHPTSPLELKGNLFILEDIIREEGTVFLLEAPLPDSRPTASDWDVRIQYDKAGTYVLSGWQDPQLESWTQLPYTGGRWGRTRTLHQWQRKRSGRARNLPVVISNTWGDRSRDSRMNAEFMLREIDCAAEMGVQVVQLDDGWQKGMTINSSDAQSGGGHWEGFWQADPDFWTPHPSRFPDGLPLLVTHAQAKGVELGLWFAPDSWQDFANWERDAACLLSLYHAHGIRHFKLDSINATTETAFSRLKQFAFRIRERSEGNIVLDLDITGDHPRPGYWGALEIGVLFLENRYTDWANYLPHHTLRNLWQLSHWIDPLRLRMEWLNPHRNPEAYYGHPLAPANWPITSLVAITLPANPLCWCELQHLPAKDRQQITPLLQLWSEHRAEWAQGRLVPLGERPCGKGLSAMASISPDGAVIHLMLYRGLGDADADWRLPEDMDGEWQIRTLFGEGTACLTEKRIQVEVNTPLGFCWLMLERG